MMSDILLDHSRPPEEASFDVVKERIQIIMETLIMEKQQFERASQRKIAHYQEEMRRKDAAITELSQQLQESRSNCDRAAREANAYKSMINDLKQEFHRMEMVISQASQRKGEKELKRVKSDYISSKEVKQASNHHGSAYRLGIFQIKSYFQEVKTHTHEAMGNLPQATKIESKIFEDNNSNTSKTVKRNKPYCSRKREKEKEDCSPLARTMQKWIQRNNCPASAQKRENYVRIRDYKENQWQQTF